MDGGSIKIKSGGGSKFWCIFVDEAKGLKQSISHQVKAIWPFQDYNFKKIKR